MWQTLVSCQIREPSMVPVSVHSSACACAAVPPAALFLLGKHVHGIDSPVHHPGGVVGAAARAVESRRARPNRACQTPAGPVHLHPFVLRTNPSSARGPPEYVLQLDLIRAEYCAWPAGLQILLPCTVPCVALQKNCNL